MLSVILKNVIIKNKKYIIYSIIILETEYIKIYLIL